MCKDNKMEPSVEVSEWVLFESGWFFCSPEQVFQALVAYANHRYGSVEAMYEEKNGEIGRMLGQAKARLAHLEREELDSP